MTELGPALEELSRLAGRVSVVARRLDSFEPISQVERSPEEIFPAASIVKIGIMSCLLDEIGHGRASLSERVVISAAQQVGGAGVLFELEPERDYSLAELCRLMMVVSDNTASNALVRRLGMERLNEFWAARDYQARLQRFFMDPVLDGRDNQMSALGAARMLRDLYLGEHGLGLELREFALGCLRRQQYREKIPAMLPPEVVVGHKTGELDGVRHDAAVVETEAPYLLVVLTAEGGSPWLVDHAIARLSLDLFGQLAGSVSPGIKG